MSLLPYRLVNYIKNDLHFNACSNFGNQCQMMPNLDFCFLNITSRVKDKYCCKSGTNAMPDN